MVYYNSGETKIESYVDDEGRVFGTVTGLSSNGVLVTLPDGKCGMIPAEILDQYYLSIDNFTIGEEIDIFKKRKSAVRAKSHGKKQKYNIDGCSILYLRYKMADGRQYISTVLERSERFMRTQKKYIPNNPIERRLYRNGFPLFKEDVIILKICPVDFQGEKSVIFENIQRLHLDETVAVSQMYRYYSRFYYRPDVRAARILIENGLLDVNGNRIPIVGEVIKTAISECTTENSFSGNE